MPVVSVEKFQYMPRHLEGHVHVQACMFVQEIRDQKLSSFVVLEALHKQEVELRLSCDLLARTFKVYIEAHTEVHNKG